MAEHKQPSTIFIAIITTIIIIIITANANTRDECVCSLKMREDE